MRNPAKSPPMIAGRTQVAHRRLATLAALATLSIAVAGCGGAAAPSAPGTAPTLGTAPASGGVAPGAAEMSPEQFCVAAVDLAKAITMQPNGQDTAASGAAMFAKAAEAWAKVAAIAPADIKPDVQRIAEAMGRAASGGGDPETVLSGIREPFAHYQQYGAQHCPRPTG